MFSFITQGVAAGLLAFALSGRYLVFFDTQGVAAGLLAFALSGRYYVFLYYPIGFCPYRALFGFL